MQLDEYLGVLDWTGRQMVRDKPGAISNHLTPILERLGAAVEKADRWLHLVTNFDKLFSHVVGTSRQLVERAACAAALGKRAADLKRPAKMFAKTPARKVCD